MSWRASGEAKKITKGVHGEKLRHADKLALLVISDDYNEHRGYAWASHKLLAEECLCSERTFIRLTQRLESFGLLSVEHRGRLGNRYRLPFMTDCHQSEKLLDDSNQSPNDLRIGDKTEQLGDRGVSPQLDVELEEDEREAAKIAAPPIQLLRKCSKCGLEALSLKGHPCPGKPKVISYRPIQRESIGRSDGQESRFETSADRRVRASRRAGAEAIRRIRERAERG